MFIPGMTRGAKGSLRGQPGERPVVETAVMARQGFLDRPVIVVLGLSLLLAIAAGVFVAYLQRF
jgi:hypothetical protein